MDVHPPKNGINRYWFIPMFWKANLTLRCPSWQWLPMDIQHPHHADQTSMGNLCFKTKVETHLLLWLWLTINTQPAIPVYDRKHIICPRLTQSYFIIQKLYESWLVLDLPLWKIWVRQLGFWHSQLNGKSFKIPWFQSAPTSNNGDHGEETVNYNG